MNAGSDEQKGMSDPEQRYCLHLVTTAILHIQ